MQIQINTDNHIQNTEAFSEELREKTAHDLEKFKSHITRVEVYLQDENKTKGGSDDKKCSIEIRIEGLKPLAATHSASTLREAHNGAIHKAQRVVGDALEKRKNHH